MAEVAAGCQDQTLVEVAGGLRKWDGGHVPVDGSAADSSVDLVKQVEHLEAALESRTVIARAQGILMERYNVDADAAIAILKRASADQQLKVREIAAGLVETRQLPGI